METLKNYVNWKLAHSDKTATAEGCPLVMENCKANKRMKQLEVYGDCFQRLGSKNLLPYPYYKTTATISGVTFTDNGDGSITVNGTATANAFFYFYQNTTTLIPGLKSGDTITVSLDSDKDWDVSSVNMHTVLNYYDATATMRNGKCVLNSSAKIKTTTITDDWCGIGFYILVFKNSTVNNITLRVQIELGTTSTEYEPYVLSPSPDYPSEIETVGNLTTKNLFDKDNALVFNGYFSDGKIVNYNPTVSRFAIICIDCKPNTAYTISRQIQSKRFRFASSTMPPGTDTVVNIFDFDDSNMNGTITTGKDDIYLYVWFYNQTIDIDYTYQEIMNGIQIEEGSIATEYEPYHKYKIPITARGKNLLPYPYVSTTKTINGVTFTDNGDGSITVNGTATANAVFYLVVSQDNYTLDKCGLKIGDRYTISKILISGDSIANVYFTANYYDENGTMKAGASISNANTATATIKYDFVMWGIYLLVLKDKTVNNTTIKLQLEKGLSATEYEPYVEPITQNIYLDEPLRKIEDYADYIDFKNQKVIRNVKEITFENKTFNEYSYGTTLDNTYHFNIRNMGCIYRTPMFCNIMKAGSITMNSDANDTFFTSMYSNVANGGIYLQIEKALIDDYSGESNVEKLKLFLLEKQAKLLYCVSEYTEEDISCQLPKTIAKTTVISAGTSLEPSNIKGKYIIK